MLEEDGRDDGTGVEGAEDGTVEDCSDEGALVGRPGGMGAIFAE